MAATLEYHLTGGSTNTDPNASLGGVMSNTTITSGQLNNLFDDVQPEEAANGDTEYRAIDIYNAGDATAVSVELYVSAQPGSGVTIQLGYDSSNSPHASDASLPTTPDESTAPSGITFGTYDASNTLSLPDIPAGQAIRVWVKRVVPAGTGNTANDSATLTVKYA